MEDQINKKPDVSHMAKATFLDPKLLLIILLVFLSAIAMTTLIGVFRNSLGTVSFGGAK